MKKILSVSTRPRIEEWIKPEKLILLQGWAMEGFTIEDIAKKIGIGKTTIYEWMQKNTNIMNALKIGREQADNIIINALFNKAKNGDTTAMIFWLKNRQADRWREKQEISNTFPQGDFTIQIKNKEDKNGEDNI